MESFINRSEPRDFFFMRLALAEARRAAAGNEVPVGAIVVLGDRLIGRGFNRREQQQSPLAHAEIAAIEEAASYLQTWRLSDCEIYVTLEPCIMCAGAILQARIGRLVFGCRDSKAGAVESLFRLCADPRLNHRLPVNGGVLAEDCAGLLEKFFFELRSQKRKPTCGEVAEHG